MLEQMSAEAVSVFKFLAAELTPTVLGLGNRPVPLCGVSLTNPADVSFLRMLDGPLV